MIKFTQHALQRSKERTVSKDLIMCVVNNPDFKYKGKLNDVILVKLINDLYLKVVVIQQGNDIIVITTHWLKKLRIKDKI